MKYETTEYAALQRKEFLLKHKIGVCDIVASAERDKIDASDLGMQNIKLRNLVVYLQEYKSVDTILFTGGNSKNGPEYFFRKHLKEHELQLKVVSDQVPRIHEFELPRSTRTVRTVSLTAPSGAANRAVGSMELYKRLKNENLDFNTLDFRVMQYRPFFES